MDEGIDGSKVMKEYGIKYCNLSDVEEYVKHEELEKIINGGK